MRTKNDPIQSRALVVLVNRLIRLGLVAPLPSSVGQAFDTLGECLIPQPGFTDKLLRYRVACRDVDGLSTLTAKQLKAIYQAMIIDRDEIARAANGIRRNGVRLFDSPSNIRRFEIESVVQVYEHGVRFYLKSENETIQNFTIKTAQKYLKYYI